MAHALSELTIGEIANLQVQLKAAATSSRGFISFEQFFGAYENTINGKGDRKLLKLIFDLVDNDGDERITWRELQDHIEILRRGNPYSADASTDMYSDQSFEQPKVAKKCQHAGVIRRILEVPVPNTMSNATQLLTSSSDGSIRQWNPQTLKYEGTLFHSHCTVVDMDFDGYTDTLMALSCDQVISIYNLAQSRLSHSFKLGRKTLATFGVQDEVYREELRVGIASPAIPFQGLSEKTSVLARLWVAKNNMFLQRVWANEQHTEAFKCTVLPSMKTNATSLTGCCHFSGVTGKTDLDDFTLFLGQQDGKIQGFRLDVSPVSIHGAGGQRFDHSSDLVKPEQNSILTWAPHKDRITCMRCDRDAEILMTSSADSDIHFLHIERGIVLRTMAGTTHDTIRSHSRGVHYFEVAKHPRLLGSWGNERFAVIWDPAVAKPLQALHGHVSHIVGLKFSPEDEHQIFTYSEDKAVRIWDTRTFRCLQQIRERSWETHGPAGALHYDRGTRTIITGTQRLYRKEYNFSKFDDSYSGHTTLVVSAFASLEKEILCTCDEYKVCMWTSTTGEPSVSWPFDNLDSICVESEGNAILLDVKGEDLRVVSTTNGHTIAHLMNSREEGSELKCLFDAQRRYWIVIGNNSILVYNSNHDRRRINFPPPTFRKSISEISCEPKTAVLLAGLRIVMGLADGGIAVVMMRDLKDPTADYFLCDKLVNPPDVRSLILGKLHGNVSGIVSHVSRLIRRRKAFLARVQGVTLDEEEDEGDKNPNEEELVESVGSKELKNALARVESLCRIRDTEFVIAGTGGAKLILLTTKFCNRLMEIRVGLRPQVSILSVEASEDGTRLFYGDDMGYIGVFDCSPLLTIAEREDCTVPMPKEFDWSSCFTRLAMFRASTSAITVIRWLGNNIGHLCICSGDGATTYWKPTGVLVKTLGVLEGTSSPFPDPEHTMEYHSTVEMYRKDAIVKLLKSGPLTQMRISEHCVQTHPELFPDVKTVDEVIADMVPTETDRQFERLLQYDHSLGVFSVLTEKESVPPTAHVTLPPAETDGVPSLASSFGMYMRRRAKRRKSRGIPKDPEHKVLPLLPPPSETSEIDSNNSSPISSRMNTPSRRGSGRRSARRHFPDGAPRNTMHAEWGYTQAAAASPKRPSRFSAPTPDHSEVLKMLSGNLSPPAATSGKSTTPALRSHHETPRLSNAHTHAMLLSKLGSKEKEQRQHIIETADRLRNVMFQAAHAKVYCQFSVRTHMATLPGSQPLRFADRSTIKEAKLFDGDTTGGACAPSSIVENELSEDIPTTEKNNNENDQEKTEHESTDPFRYWRRFRRSCLAPRWSHELASLRNTRIRQSILSFTMAAENVVKTIVQDRIGAVHASSIVRQAEPFHWVSDGISAQLLTSPLTAMHPAVARFEEDRNECTDEKIPEFIVSALGGCRKCGLHEVHAATATLSACEDLAFPVLPPLCCVVQLAGLSFFCSAVLDFTLPKPSDPSASTMRSVNGANCPADTLRLTQVAADALPQPPVVKSVWHVASSQLLGAIGVEGSLSLSTAPPSLVAGSPQPFMISVVGVASIMPRHVDVVQRWGCSASLRMRTETLKGFDASTNLSSSSFDPAVPAGLRVAHERGAVKVSRKVSSILIPALVQQFLRMAIGTIQPNCSSQLIHEIHSQGVNLRFLGSVTVSLRRAIQGSAGLGNAMTRQHRRLKVPSGAPLQQVHGGTSSAEHNPIMVVGFDGPIHSHGQTREDVVLEKLMASQQPITDPLSKPREILILLFEEIVARTLKELVAQSQRWHLWGLHCIKPGVEQKKVLMTAIDVNRGTVFWRLHLAGKSDIPSVADYYYTSSNMFPGDDEETKQLCESLVNEIRRVGAPVIDYCRNIPTFGPRGTTWDAFLAEITHSVLSYWLAPAQRKLLGTYCNSLFGDIVSSEDKLAYEIPFRALNMPRVCFRLGQLTGIEFEQVSTDYALKQSDTVDPAAIGLSDEEDDDEDSEQDESSLESNDLNQSACEVMIDDRPSRRASHHKLTLEFLVGLSIKKIRATTKAVAPSAEHCVRKMPPTEASRMVEEARVSIVTAHTIVPSEEHSHETSNLPKLQLTKFLSNNHPKAPEATRNIVGWCRRVIACSPNPRIAVEWASRMAPLEAQMRPLPPFTSEQQALTGEQWAITMFHAGKHHEAIEMLEEVLKYFTSSSEAHIHAVHIAVLLAEVYFRLRYLSKAMKYAEMVASIARTVDGGGSNRLLAGNLSIEVLQNNFCTANRLAEFSLFALQRQAALQLIVGTASAKVAARAALVSAADRSGLLVGRTHPITREISLAIGSCLLRMEEEKEALEVLLAVLRTTALEFGHWSLPTSECLLHVGDAYRQRGERGQAIRAYSIAKKIQTTCGVSLASSIHRLARILLETGHFLSAEKRHCMEGKQQIQSAHNEAVALLRQVLLTPEVPSQSPAVLTADGVTCVLMLGKIAIEEGEFDTAFSHATRMLQSAELVYGPRSMEAGDALFAAADVMYRQGQIEEAIQAFTVTKGIFISCMGELHPDVAYVDVFLGRCHGALGDSMTATRILRDAIARFKQHSAEDTLNRYRHCIVLADLGVLLLSDAEEHIVRENEEKQRAAGASPLPDFAQICLADQQEKSSPGYERSSRMSLASATSTRSSVTRSRPRSTGVGGKLDKLRNDVHRRRILGTTLQSQYEAAMECISAASHMALAEFSDVEHPFVVRLQGFIRLCQERLATFDAQNHRVAQLGEHHKLLQEWLVLQPGSKLANGDVSLWRKMQPVYRLRNWY